MRTKGARPRRVTTRPKSFQGFDAKQGRVAELLEGQGTVLHVRVQAIAADVVNDLRLVDVHHRAGAQLGDPLRRQGYAFGHDGERPSFLIEGSR
jgi:hypothetical protein